MTDSNRLHNRDAFLSNLTRKLGRDRLTQPAPFSLTKSRQHEVLQNASSDDLLTDFINYAQSKLMVQTYLATRATLVDKIKQDCLTRFANHPGTVLISQDVRLNKSFDTCALTNEGFTVKHWQPQANVSEQIQTAEQAQVGIVFAEQALVESGTIVLQSSHAQGRSISLLPEHSIFVIRKSTLLPRVTQACESFHLRAQQGERLPSCINFISGPSSTADIELIKVVGVHGPISASYVILEDE